MLGFTERTTRSLCGILRAIGRPISDEAMILRSQHQAPVPSESSEAKKQPVTRGKAKKRAAPQPAPQPIVMAQEENQSRVVMYYSGSSQSTGAYTAMPFCI